MPELSERTKAEMEEGRKSVAYAEARLKAKQESEAALAASDAAKEIEAEVEFVPPKKKK